jgi:hypothetical protein
MLKFLSPSAQSGTDPSPETGTDPTLFQVPDPELQPGYGNRNYYLESRSTFTHTPTHEAGSSLHSAPEGAQAGES